MCILEGEINPESLASQPLEMFIFQKPLIFAILDINGGVTIWSRDDSNLEPGTATSSGEIFSLTFCILLDIILQLQF